MTQKEHLMRSIALLVIAASAAGCASVRENEFAQDALAAPGVAYNAAHRAMSGPHLQPVGTPAALTGGEQQTMPLPEPVVYEAARPSSLWRS